MRFRNRLIAVLAACAACLLPGLPAVAAPTTTHTLTLNGRSVQVDVILPERTPQAAAIVAHGFTRSRSNMTGHGAALAQAGVLAVMPDLPFFSSRENARILVELIELLKAGTLAPRVDRIVLIGFSAGGLATLLAAATPGVVGYIGLDSFDRPGGMGLDFAKTLRTPAVLLYGPNAFCNAYGIAAPWRTALPALARERFIEGASHCDFEAPTDVWCELPCGKGDPARQKVIRDEILENVNRILLVGPAGR